MRLLRRRERLLDADMRLLLRSESGPHPTSDAQRSRLLNLCQVEQPAEEPSRLRLASRRSGKLNVVEPEYTHVHNLAHRRSVPRGGGPPAPGFPEGADAAVEPPAPSGPDRRVGNTCSTYPLSHARRPPLLPLLRMRRGWWS
jgi:hypothetical protein